MGSSADQKWAELQAAKQPAKAWFTAPGGRKFDFVNVVRFTSDFA